MRAILVRWLGSFVHSYGMVWRRRRFVPICTTSTGWATKSKPKTHDHDFVKSSRIFTIFSAFERELP